MDADDGATDVLQDLEEEPDVNDWVEIFWGCFLVAIGLHLSLIHI